MNVNDKRDYRNRFRVKSVGSGIYGEGFYDALQHVDRIMMLRLTNEQYKVITDLLKSEQIQGVK